MSKHTDNNAGSKSCREDATDRLVYQRMRNIFYQTPFSRCSSNCIQQPEDNAEFKDTASYPGLGNTPPKKCLFSPYACLALPLKRRLACEHLKIFHKQFFSLQFCFEPSSLPLCPQENGGTGFAQRRVQNSGGLPAPSTQPSLPVFLWNFFMLSW